MHNSNFGYDCRNNLDNCKFVPIFHEIKEVQDILIILIKVFQMLLPQI